ncbi:ATP-binding protein [Streptomyces lunaelactis]|uniref:ATP-binding protein n=1 Tax=Streptomyces lunaelactis TaxID=1535768 RepID=UPI0015846AAF|nr:ATP-binding protein [Streptomyces lunaelactis]NUK00320.1 ATP-binding protein [Streptomyces lunaelactis]NUK14915.1 ATP-binding protein [Streptomyces lunaelactis]NUK22109.1 ATP-binding protein [Streptomyces lunaelactis]NUK34265.1 ATP-binding protein [Streptomyces lunaelactis]NUK40519.1 ATP-binding protein [Streptomyces lunaelactis]
MAIMDGLRSINADRPRPSLAAQPGPTRHRALRATRAVAAAVPELRHFARRTAQQWAIPDESSDALSLVVSELVTNAVLHSGSADVTALIVFDGVAVTVEVTDSGRWLARGANRCVAEDEDADFGRGLDLVRACTSWCMVQPSAAGTRVVARLPVAESGADR